MQEHSSIKGNDNALVHLVEAAIQIPGIKVNRDAFLLSVFEKRIVTLKTKSLKLALCKLELKKRNC